MEQALAMAPMPQYQCHKKVWALQIKGVRREEDQWVLSFRGKDFSPIVVSDEWFARHLKPHEVWSGGYYVQYEDGYVSYSPQKAFEEGYTRLK